MVIDNKNGQMFTAKSRRERMMAILELKSREFKNLKNHKRGPLSPEILTDQSCLQNKKMPFPQSDSADPLEDNFHRNAAYLVQF